MTSFINNKSQGAYKATSWIKEGDNLLLSSIELRKTWEANRNNLRTYITTQKKPTEDIFINDSALSRSSILLLGYSLEMFLKAGLLKLYAYCPEALVRSELRNFGHKYSEISKRIYFEEAESDDGDFNILSRSVVEDARYPITPLEDTSYLDQLNEITALNRDPITYKRLETLARRVRAYVTKLNQDSSNPASFSARKTTFGYFVTRIGGGLPPIVIYKSNTSLNLSEIHQEISNHSTILGHWDTYKIFEDISKKNERRHCKQIMPIT